MTTHPLLKLLLGVLSLFACCELGYAQALPATTQLVVVELFQSQGCSSCPPAEANLNAITGQPDILTLSYGVTYWDSLGWKDTFATQTYTDRQSAYAQYHKRNNVWTPQIYVNGHTDLVGSDRTQLDQAIKQANAHGPQLSWQKGQLLISAGKPLAVCDVWLVRYDPRTINVAIGAGENGGRTLPHRNVVRELVHLGNWDGNPRSFTVPPPALKGLSTAALVQIKAGGDILSASRDSAAR